jgi:hypothetical protein
VRLHTETRAQGQWLSAGELEQATKGGQHTLHSRSVQALSQKFAVTVTATTLRQQELTETGRIKTEYPHHTKSYQTVVWKDDQALQILPDGSLRLPSGGQRPPLLLPLPLPQEFRAANLRRAKLSWLTWRADHI